VKIYLSSLLFTREGCLKYSKEMSKIQTTKQEQPIMSPSHAPSALSRLKLTGSVSTGADIMVKSSSVRAKLQLT
jgi:hypothetical protein